MSNLDYSKEGVQHKVKGQLHYMAKRMKSKRKEQCQPKDGKIIINSEFPVSIADYKISLHLQKIK